MTVNPNRTLDITPAHRALESRDWWDLTPAERNDLPRRDYGDWFLIWTFVVDESDDPDFTDQDAPCAHDIPLEAFDFSDLTPWLHFVRGERAEEEVSSIRGGRGMLVWGQHGRTKRFLLRVSDRDAYCHSEAVKACQDVLADMYGLRHLSLEIF